MTNKQKIAKVQAEMKLSKTEAAKVVKFLDWCLQWDAVLKLMFENYKKEVNGDIKFLAFQQLIYSNDKNVPATYIKNSKKKLS